MPAKCSVCRGLAQYTCPRCDAAYCGVECYKEHSSHCTESFYRESAVKELKSVTATAQERENMVEILRRLHVQAAEEQSGSGESSDGGDSGGEGPGLSEATVQRLFAKVAMAGGDFEVTEEDLAPEDLEAFHRELASGRLGRRVARWDPWWLSREAAELDLAPTGMRFVGALEPERQPGSQGDAGPSSTLPDPPTTPLLPLSALLKGDPSPHLHAALVDLLYAYCFVLRLYNGDYKADPAGAADTALALSATLASAGALEVPPSAALLGCIERAYRLPGIPAGGFGVGVLHDVVAVLQRGRPVVLTALMDLSRLLDAGRQEVKAAHRAQNAQKEKGKSAAAQALLAAQRKLVFFLSWSNERPLEAYALLAAQAEAVLQEQEATRRPPPEVTLAPPLAVDD